MKLHTFGTCSGTQPYPNFRHTCLAVETEFGLYFLDAGESGSYTAHLMGVDLLKTKAVFISHPHMDHVGGLGNLLWNIRKIGYVNNNSLTENDNIEILTPCIETVEGFFSVLKNTEGEYKTEYTHSVKKIKEGKIFDNGDIAVYATHTDHMEKRNGEYQSFSFRIVHNGKVIVYSGDTRLENIKDILPDECNAFLVETGHHQIEDICSEIKKNGKIVKKLYFVHHGGYIMRDIDGAKRRAESCFDNDVEITRDAMTYEV